MPCGSCGEVEFVAGAASSPPPQPETAAKHTKTRSHAAARFMLFETLVESLGKRGNRSDTRLVAPTNQSLGKSTARRSCMPEMYWYTL